MVIAENPYDAQDTPDSPDSSKLAILASECNINAFNPIF